MSLLAFAVVALALAEPSPPSSAKSQVLLRYECRNDLGRREITLFGNGTVRLREGLKEDPVMTLGELSPAELEGFLARLAAEDLSEVPSETDNALDGAWIESCRLELSLPSTATRRYGFGRYDSLPLNLSRVVRIAEDLAGKVDPRSRQEHLPPGYDPRPGDVLKRVDGELFRIVGPTADKLGVELIGVKVPLTLYLPKGQLANEFVELVSRLQPH
jgi:hypothetical protein